MERLKQFAGEHGIQFAVPAVLYYLNFAIVARMVACLVEPPGMELDLRTLILLLQLQLVKLGFLILRRMPPRPVIPEVS